MYKHILVPLDGARAGARAIDHAEALATQYGSAVSLLRVVPPERLAGASMGTAETMASAQILYEEIEREEGAHLRQARSYLNARRRALEKAGVKEVHTYCVKGDPAAVILDYAKRQKVDLIVMTTRGRSGISRALLGSVADQVIRSAIAPVLVIKRKQ